MTSITLSVAARPTLVFVAAYMTTMTSHEVAHALMACQLGFASTIFQLWVSPETADATPAQMAAIAATGPAFSLMTGALGWIGYRLRQRSLGFLMMGLVGTYACLGPWIGAALGGGDMHIVLRALDAPPAIRVVISIAGALGLAAFMFWCGKLLARNAPPGISRVPSVLVMIAGPWVIGTALAVLLYLPLPRELIFSTVGGSVFWLFAVIGGAVDRDVSPRPPARAIGYADAGFALAAFVIVRMLSGGVRLAPW